MLRNHFTPIEPVVLQGLEEIEHNFNKVDFQCGIVANIIKLVHVAHSCIENENDVIVVPQKSSLTVLRLIDHEHREQVSLMMPGFSEDLLAINNGPLAHALLVDTISRVAIKSTRLYEDSASGQMVCIDKRFMEVNLLDAGSKEQILHTFWCGDQVTDPIHGLVVV